MDLGRMCLCIQFNKNQKNYIYADYKYFGMIECMQFVTGVWGLYLQKPGVGLDHPCKLLPAQDSEDSQATS